MALEIRRPATAIAMPEATRPGQLPDTSITQTTSMVPEIASGAVLSGCRDDSGAAEVP